MQFLVVRQAAEGQFGGVEEVAAEAERIFATAVEVVADDGEANVGQVDANLVLAAGVGAALDRGVGVGSRARAEVVQGAVGGLGRAGVAARRRHDGHFLPVARVAADRRVDERLRRLEAAVDQGQIDLGHGAVLELVLQIPKGVIVLGGDDEAAGVLVQPVDDARPPLAADALQVGAVGQQGVDQRAAFVAQRRMDDHAGRFVDDDQVAVFVAHVQRDVLGLDDGLDHRRHGGHQPLAALDAVAGAGALAVHRDQSLADEPLPLHPRQIGQGGRQGAVEAFADSFQRQFYLAFVCIH